jgi:hypothetical protein
VADAKRREKQLSDSVSGKIIAEVNQPKVNPVDKNSQKLVISRFERDL